MGPSALCQTRRSETAEFRKQTVKFVKPKQMLLPLPSAKPAVMVESDSAWVVDVTVATRSVLLVRFLNEEPVDPGGVSEPSFLP